MLLQLSTVCVHMINESQIVFPASSALTINRSVDSWFVIDFLCLDKVNREVNRVKEMFLSDI